MALLSAESAPAILEPGRLAAVRENTAASSNEDSDESGSSSEEAKEVKAAPRNFTAPKVWMILFGVLLACCAGAVDVITFRGLSVLVSHVTGTVAKTGARLEGVAHGLNEPLDVLHAMLLVGCFIVGAFLCGLVIPKNQVHFGGKSFYGVALLGNSCLLIVAACVAPSKPVSGDDAQQSNAIAAGCLAAMACGLQNAMCTMHFGAIVRTTHVTGTSTDIGSTAGRAAMILLRTGCSWKRAGVLERADLLDDATKLSVLVCIFVGFFIGTIFGAFLHSHLGILALLVPAGVTGSTGFLYVFFRTALKRQLKKIEERRLQEEMLEVDACLERSRSLLASASAADREDLGDLEDILGHSLAMAHDVEATIAELCHVRELAATHVARSRTM